MFCQISRFIFKDVLKVSYQKHAFPDLSGMIMIMMILFSSSSYDGYLFYINADNKFPFTWYRFCLRLLSNISHSSDIEYKLSILNDFPCCLFLSPSICQMYNILNQLPFRQRDDIESFEQNLISVPHN